MSKILVTRSSIPELEEYIAEIRDIWDTHWLTNMGIKHRKLQEALCEYLQVAHTELFTNGHMALEMSLQALDLEGEVITTPFTFSSTVHAIVRNGLKPVFCDIREDDFTLDPEKIESLITDRTCAIMPVHVYGNICGVKAIEHIAKKHGLKVIYDAAHSFGETLDGKGVGSFGDVSCFSFHATKVFNTIEGGAACYRDESLGTRLYQLKNFGIRDEEHVDAVGANAKMNEFCAAMGLCNLRHVDEDIAKRKAIVEIYRGKLDGVEGIQLSVIQENVKSNYSYFPVVVDETAFGTDRNGVYDALAKEDIIARKYFWPLVSEYGCYRDQYDPADTPVAKRISSRVLTLPLYPDLAPADAERICDIILKCGKAKTEAKSR